MLVREIPEIKIRIREGALNDARDVWNRQRPQQRGVCQCENRGRCPGAKRKREHGAGAKERCATKQSQRVTNVDFSGDGRYLVSAAEDGVATVWTVPDGRPVTTFRTHAARLTAAAFAPHGRDFALGGDDGRTVVVDCAECRTLHSLICLAAERIVSRGLRARREPTFASCD